MGGETRERILEVAARLFHEQGYEATTVASILRAAEVNSGSLYHFFPGKGALLVGVLERYVRLLPQTMLDPTEGAVDDPIGRVFALLEVYRRRLLVSGCAKGCPVGDLALEVASRDPQARAQIELYFSEWVRRVESWLKSAGDRLPAEADRRALARFVLGVMEGGVMQAKAAGTLEPFDASVSQLRIHLELLQARGRRAAADAPLSAAGETAVAVDREAVEEAGAAGETGWRSW